MIILNSASKIIEDDIAKIECDLEIKLPEDYKYFMLQSNGGTPKEDMLFDFFDEVQECENTSVIRNIFSLYLDDSNRKFNYKVIYNIMVNDECIPADMVPIADDPGGNVISISLNKDDYGYVYFLNQDFEDEDTGYLVKSKIANSFKDFIDCLYVDESE